MSQPQNRELSLPWRGRLIGALIVMAALAVLSAVGIGVSLHAWSETLDSLHHWQARQAEEAAGPDGGTHETGFGSSGSRVRRLEEELDAIPERLFASGAMFVMASVLLVLGYRKLRADRREFGGG